MVSKAPTEKQPVDKWAILLSSIFFQKPVNGFHDIPAAYLHERAEKREFPSFYWYGWVSAACIYGDFVFDIMLQSFIMTYYEDLDLDQFESVLPDFRRRVIREFIYDIHPDRVDETESYISHNSISVFLKTVAENKIRDDMVIREVSQVIYTYMVGSDPRREGEEIQILPTEVIDADFEEQERAARLKRIDPKYEKNVKNIDLKILKRLLCDDEWNSFDPKGWQKDMLTNLRRFNFVAASRRAWKSFLSCYLAARQLMIPDQNIIFVVPELRSHWRVPWKYLLKMMGKNPNIRFDKSDRTIKNRENNSEIIFFSGAREDSVRGSAANLLVFDEAAYLSEMVYESASALVRTTNGIVYAITTPNIDTPKNRFYYKLIDAEIARFDIGSEKYGVRITLRENPFIPDKEKELIYKDGQTNLKIFNCEYMAWFAEGREFDLSRFWIIDYKPVEIMVGGAWLTNVRYEAFAKEVSINPYKHFIISYDCAKKKDRPGISLLGLRQWGADLVLADYMQNIDYVDQVRLILELRKMLGENRVSIVIDYNWVGIAVEELFRRTHNVPVIGIQTTSNREAIRVWAVWQVNKDQVMWKLKSAMGRDVIKGYSFQHNLRLEFETYDDVQSRNYGHHYDILMSLAYGVWVADKYWYMNAYVYGAEDRTNDFLVDGLSEETDYSDQLFPTQERNEWEREEKYGY